MLLRGSILTFSLIQKVQRSRARVAKIILTVLTEISQIRAKKAIKNLSFLNQEFLQNLLLKNKTNKFKPKNEEVNQIYQQASFSINSLLCHNSPVADLNMDKVLIKDICLSFHQILRIQMFRLVKSHWQKDLFCLNFKSKSILLTKGEWFYHR